VKFRGVVSLVCAALALQALPKSAKADTNEDGYVGKSITLIVGSAAGGLFDFGGRLFARFLPKYIPGHPTVVVQNMPGASSVIAAAYLYHVAPHDGLTIGTLQPTIVLNKAQDPSLKYEPEKFTWIGRVQPIVFVGVGWRASGVNSFADATNRTIIVSAQGAAGISAIIPWALDELAGARFRVVTGYTSEGPAFVAMERGEVQGIGSAALGDVLEKKDWADKNSVALLYTLTAKRSALSPQTPAIPELAKDEFGRKVLTLLGQGLDVGQNLVAPPDIPAGRKAVLRNAFDQMVKDPEFVSQATKLGINVDPLSGADLSTLVTGVSDAPADVLQRMRDVTRPR
jgi:tripartite-type tricarboxylate transporter receptor subunit TctC